MDQLMRTRHAPDLDPGQDGRRIEDKGGRRERAGPLRLVRLRQWQRPAPRPLLAAAKRMDVDRELLDRGIAEAGRPRPA